MKLKNTILILYVLISVSSFSQELNFNILTIPDSLKQNANSVVRFYDTNIELASHKKMIIKIKKAVTVLNKLGNHESKIRVYYDKNTNIKSLKAIVYNSFGKEIKKISKSKFNDYAAADGFSLFNDNRLKYYRHVPISYPYTIYYEYQIETSNTAFIPRWMPIDSYFQSVEKAIFTTKHPINLPLRFSENLLSNFRIKKDKEESFVKYSISSFKAIKFEDYSPSIISVFPTVSLAINKFSLEGVEGQANNWQEFGKWRYNYLLNGKDKINDAVKLEVQNLVKNIKDPIEKARIIYQYVQDRTRYVSVQEGIGGWKPIKADEVHKVAYGDCKGLTNYTKTLLDAVGVKSHYSVIWAGNRKKDVKEDFFSMQGNHVILNLPNDGNDIWLECTSQTVPFGYQGTFTDDRNVLVITPEGGKIKKTTSYPEENNYQKTVANYSVDSLGNLSAKLSIVSKGTQYRNHYELERKSKKEIDEYYKSDYWSYLNNLSINKVKFKNDRRKIAFTETLKITSNNYASISGNNMLITLNAFNRYTSVPKRYRNRQFAIETSRGFLDEDEFDITLPNGYKIEALPEDKVIKTKFGEYQISIDNP